MAANDENWIGIDLTGIDNLQEKLKQLYPELADLGTEEANAYILDVVKEDARLPYADEPFFWSSDKQRKAYFASNGFGGGIPYQRTGTLRDGWQVLGYGKNQIVVNEVMYSKYVKQASTQIIGMKFRDWDTIEEQIRTRLSQISRAFNEGVRDAIEKLGLG